MDLIFDWKNAICENIIEITISWTDRLGLSELKMYDRNSESKNELLMDS